MKIGKRQQYTKGETIHKTIQKNTEYTKQKTNKIIFKNLSPVIGK
jgi:hypothetical protein